MGFSHIFSAMVELFGYIYMSGQLLFTWLSTPLLDTAGDNVSLLGDFALYTPIELMFGPGLFLILILCLVKFLFPLS